MTANTPIRAASSGDLVNFRTDNQGVKLGLAILAPATIYTARINQTLSAYDCLIEIIYDGGSGTLANVLPGMTMYIGSSAGARDKGTVRIRKAPTATKFYIGKTSDILFANGDYLTVVNDFELWQKDISRAGNIIKMDSEIIFANRGGSCIIRAAPMVAVIKLVEGVATFTPPSPALSACYDGATISSWLYVATGAASSSNMTSGTGTASWTYESAGQYRWSLTVTDSIGRTTTTYRWVFVDPTSLDFVLSSNPTSDVSSGGWSFGITMFDNATIANVVDRALVVLYADAEYFDGLPVTIGKLTGYENIICVGWIDGESIVKDSQQGQVTFEVHGAAHWLDKIRASAIAISNTNGTPAKWTQVKDLDADKALAHILSWTSTLPMIMDCFFSGSTVPIDLLAQPSGSLLSQIQSAASNTIFANTIVNNLGQLFIEVDPQMLTTTQKSNLTSVMTITTADYEGQLEFLRKTSGADAMIELHCNVFDTSRVMSVYSRAPGNTGKVYGQINAPGNYYADDQAECNRLAGCLLATGNAKYDPLEITLVMQNRLIDIAPSQVCILPVASGDTPRGIVLTNQKLIPRRVSFDFSNGFYKTTTTFEMLIASTDGVTYYPPTTTTPTVPIDIPDVTPDIPSPDIVIPPTLPEDPIVTPVDCKTSTDFTNAPGNQFTLTWDKTQLSGADVSAADRTASAYMPCSIRKTGCVYGTNVYIAGVFEGVTADTINVYGVSGGSRVATATCGVGLFGILATFAPDDAVDVDGFEMEIDYGTGVFLPGDVIATGTVLGTSTGTEIAVEIGEWYAMDGAGGPWLYQVSDPSALFYNFALSLDGANWSSRADYYGIGKTCTNDPLMRLDLGGILAFAEAIDDLYARAYFQATGTSIYFAVSDSAFGDNGGSLDYILRSATTGVRTALINLSTLNNVCAV